MDIPSNRIWQAKWQPLALPQTDEKTVISGRAAAKPVDSGDTDTTIGFTF